MQESRSFLTSFDDSSKLLEEFSGLSPCSSATRTLNWLATLMEVTTESPRKCHLAPKGNLYSPFPTEWNGMQSTQRNRTEGKFSFYSVRLEDIVGPFPQNCSYPFRLKVDFQAGRSKLLAISFPSKKSHVVINFIALPAGSIEEQRAGAKQTSTNLPPATAFYSATPCTSIIMSYTKL
uniref:Uncharacterized protein n=1 Tax=Romanomermis culicivorax TaxID=13658 RepID=A0A915KSZ2_ROMCU